jgi:hypothetical protein
MQFLKEFKGNEILHVTTFDILCTSSFDIVCTPHHGNT